MAVRKLCAEMQNNMWREAGTPINKFSLLYRRFIRYRRLMFTSKIQRLIFHKYFSVEFLCRLFIHVETAAGMFLQDAGGVQVTYRLLQ